MFSRVFGEVRDDLAIVDSQFPQKNPMAFRNTEINEYFKRISNVRIYTMYPMQPSSEAWFSHGYGMAPEEFSENLSGYLKHFPNNRDRIRYLKKTKKYSFKLAYSFFLAETFVLLPFYEKNRIPFVFVLYPGGSFGLENENSDRMLRKIFRSKYFRQVIVTQRITKDYLLRKRLCTARKITYIYGGFVQFKKNELLPKKLYKRDKNTFDICFVAAKYSDRGIDKGYDIFIEVAKQLCAKTKDIMFHVVGGFDKNDIDTSKIKKRIKFYGYKEPSFLSNFYSGMDIFLGPGRLFKLYPGNFDGFPLGVDAGYCGVALFVSDQLKMNRYYQTGEEIVIIPTNASRIVKKILSYYNNPATLYDLSMNGQRKTQQLFDIDFQIDERIKVFSKFVKLELISR
jgi:glycosyltransferase involved in cell wall biosynthesis